MFHNVLFVLISGSCPAYVGQGAGENTINKNETKSTATTTTCGYSGQGDNLLCVHTYRFPGPCNLLPSLEMVIYTEKHPPQVIWNWLWSYSLRLLSNSNTPFSSLNPAKWLARLQLKMLRRTTVIARKHVQYFATLYPLKDKCYAEVPHVYSGWKN